MTSLPVDADEVDPDETVGVLVMSHGTPRSLDELPAFYTEIRRGRPPTPELLADLESRYRAIGGASPLAEHTQAQVAGIARSLEMLRPGRFVAVSGTKFAHPRIETAVAELARAGARRAIGIVLAPHSSVVSVGEYVRRRARGGRADTRRRPTGPRLQIVEHWHLTPGFVLLLAERVREALSSLHDEDADATEVLFTAHSVPAKLSEEGDGYEDQVRESAGAMAEAAGVGRWRSHGRARGAPTRPGWDPTSER